MKNDILKIRNETKEQLDQIHGELENEIRNVAKAKEAYTNTVADFDRKILNLKTMISSMNQEQVNLVI